MKHLKKTTVKKIIDLSTGTHRNDANANSFRIRFLGELETMPKEEFHELNALAWLGKEQTLLPENWDVLVEKAKDSKPEDLLNLRQLPQYMRYGMERLIRQKKRPVLAQDEERRQKLVGQFVLDSFRKELGEEHAHLKLLAMMEEHGFIKSIEDRHLFRPAGKTVVSEVHSEIKRQKA